MPAPSDPSTPGLATPDEAERAFYAAFAAADIEAMSAVWLEDDTSVCIHPMRPRLLGWAAIRQSWQAIFTAGEPMRFSLTTVRRQRSESMAVHSLYEDIRFGPGFAGRSLILATNVYLRTPEGWRIQIHHGSPIAAPPPGAETEGGRAGPGPARTVH